MVFGRTKCAYCGTLFRYPRDFGVVRYCSAVCRVTADPPQFPWEYKGCTGNGYYNRRRRKSYNRGDRIDPLVLFEAFDWTCMLCGGTIDPALKMPDKMCATIDHVKPLSLGGGHTWDNIQPAHLGCNETKDNNL